MKKNQEWHEVHNETVLIKEIIEQQAKVNALVEQLKAVSPHLFKSKKTSNKFPISMEIMESLGIHAQSITEQTANDFIAHRKAKKAPITKTVMNGFLRESQKAGISLENAIIVSIERNWQGFKAEWYQQAVNKLSKNNGNPANWTDNNVDFFDSMNSQDF